MSNQNFNSYDNTDLTGKEDNVLKTIYMLKEHIETLTLIWKGLAVDDEGRMYRISEPFACDNFIYDQINLIKSILNSHTFVSNVNREERNNILLETYASFLFALLREPTVERNKRPMMMESFYNTLFLFLNIVKDGAGAEFTLGAQTGITADVYKRGRDNELKPIVDVPKMFGFGKKQQSLGSDMNNYANITNNTNNNNMEDLN